MLTPTWKAPGLDLELHLSSAAQTDSTIYQLTGTVRGASAAALAEGGSLLVLNLASGLAEEVFLDGDASFAVDLELVPDADNHFRLTVYDAFGREAAGATLLVRQGRCQQAAPAQPAGLEPAWPHFARRVKECLYRAPQEWFEQVYAQERYAEEAYAAHDQARYRECFDNLGELARYLEQLCHDHLPG
jgi:hypothetical protein